MKINSELITKLAKLSHLHFNDEEAKEIKKDLEEIIELVEKLKEVDVENVEPLIHISPAKDRMRADEVSLEISKADALKNAPAHNGNFFIVPKVVKKD